MNTELMLKYSQIAFIALCAAMLVLMGRKRLFAEHRLLAILLGVQAIDSIVSVVIMFFRATLGIARVPAYKIFVYSHWTTFISEEILQVLIIYSVFSLALKPLQGLHNIGKIIFRWVAGVSIIVSLAFAAGPHFVAPGYGLSMIYGRIVSQSQQGISILTLCLLLFVCFSTKPLGLTYGSRTFGITLGLGVIAMTNLVSSAWLSVSAARSLYSPIYLFGVLGVFFAVAVWGVYFAMPEPERKLVLLPTTSPFFFWNRISEALGDSPGHVAIAGFRPSMLAPAEMQMLSAPSMRRVERDMPEDAKTMLPAPAYLSALGR